MSSKQITDRIVNKAPTKVRDRKSTPIATKDKDANIIHNLFAEFHYADDLGVIKSKLVDYVTTARKEARAAAFRDAVAIAEARCKDVPDSVDFEQDKNAFAAGYSVAAGSVKAGLERASKAG